MATRSKQLFEQAQQYIPGGVNSSVRSFGPVGGPPLFIERGQGARVWDADGREYIDYLGSWGPLILGHADPDVVAALQKVVANGTSFGAPTTHETELARRVCEAVPSVDRVRFVNSGTEATMSAIRLARGYTGRDRLVKFEGCYHGHVDSLLVKAGSGALSIGAPSGAGIPAALTQYTSNLPFNDLDSVQALFEQIGEEIAAVIVEPVAGNMGCVPPEPDFLPGLRELCNRYGAVLIFDEVMTGFRLALGGAQAYYQVYPDLTALGKVIGGGMPVGAFGGRADIMDWIAPTGPVYQAGTLAGNPMAMVAGIETLRKLYEPQFYTELEARTLQLAEGLEASAAEAGIPLEVNRVPGMLSPFFSDFACEGHRSIRSFQDVQACNTERFARFFHSMLERGVYLAPSPYECGFLCRAHSDDDVTTTLEAAREAFAKL